MSIYVLCPDIPSPVGGIKILYRHVDLLRREGIEASILHTEPGFRCTWFENSTPVTYFPTVSVGADDILMLPEICGPRIEHIFPGVRKVVFNQNAYYTFTDYPLDDSLETSSYTHPDVIGVVVVSEDNREYLQHAFPGVPVCRIHNAIDPTLFKYRKSKKPQACFMPRKHPEDARQVLNILRFRGALRNVTVIPIEKMNEAQVADVMRDSAFFFSFGYPEGCPLPPAEAMACGCIVVGYHGMGGREYFKPEFSYPIDIGDIRTFAATAETALSAWADDRTSFMRKGRAASEFVLTTYSKSRERRDILDAWKKLLP